MARTSKKNKERAGLSVNVKPSKMYSVGIYAVYRWMQMKEKMSLLKRR